MATKKWTPKQALAYLKRTKDTKKQKHWIRQYKWAVRRVKKDLDRLHTRMTKPKRQYYREKASKQRFRKLQWAIKQGIHVKQTDRQLIESKAQKQLKISKKMKRKKDNVLNYLKPKTISESIQNYTVFTENNKLIWNELLEKGLKTQKNKRKAINRKEEFKNFLEVKIEVTGYYKDTIYNMAGATIRGKTLEEIKDMLQEWGIRPGKTLGSKEWNGFVDALMGKNLGYEYTEDNSNGKITDIQFITKLIRGK